MTPVPFFNVASAQVAQHKVSVRRIRGNFSGAAAAWLMLFDNNGEPVTANGVAPIIAACPLYPGAPFFIEEELGSLELYSGLYAAVSSTQETLTLSGALMDITVELSDPEEPTGTTFIGDTVTVIPLLAVYADGQPNVNLLMINATNNSGGLLYLQLFTGTYVNGTIPHMTWTFQNGQNRILRFGKQGIHPIDGAVAAETQGCTLIWSTTPNVATGVAGGAPIQAEYK
jgi:hypothetical protein